MSVSYYGHKTQGTKSYTDRPVVYKQAVINSLEIMMMTIIWLAYMITYTSIRQTYQVQQGDEYKTDGRTCVTDTQWVSFYSVW